jgi:ferritin
MDNNINESNQAIQAHEPKKNAQMKQELSWNNRCLEIAEIFHSENADQLNKSHSTLSFENHLPAEKMYQYLRENCVFFNLPEFPNDSDDDPDLEHVLNPFKAGKPPILPVHK